VTTQPPTYQLYLPVIFYNATQPGGMQASPIVRGEFYHSQ
jgi:hypothetical protein